MFINELVMDGNLNMAVCVSLMSARPAYEVVNHYYNRFMDNVTGYDKDLAAYRELEYQFHDESELL